MARRILLSVGFAGAFGFEYVTLIVEGVFAFFGLDLVETFLARVFECGGDACFTPRERSFYLILLRDHVGICRFRFDLAAQFLGCHRRFKLRTQLVRAHGEITLQLARVNGEITHALTRSSEQINCLSNA